MTVMRVGDHYLKSLPGYEAGKLPAKTEIIVQQVWRDKDWHVTRTEYYRTVTEERRTVGGPEMAIRSEPNADWPAIPIWQLGWLWIHESLMTSFWVEIDRDTYFEAVT